MKAQFSEDHLRVPSSYATVMIDRQTDEIGHEPPLNMMFNMMYVMNNLKPDRRKSEEQRQGGGGVTRKRRGGKISLGKTEHVYKGPKWNAEVAGSRDKEGGGFKVLKVNGPC